jgi:hypothetical protein
MANEDPITEILEHRSYGNKKNKKFPKYDEDDLGSCVLDE